MLCESAERAPLSRDEEFAFFASSSSYSTLLLCLERQGKVFEAETMLDRGGVASRIELLLPRSGTDLTARVVLKGHEKRNET